MCSINTPESFKEQAAIIFKSYESKHCPILFARPVHFAVFFVVTKQLFGFHEHFGKTQLTVSYIWWSWFPSYIQSWGSLRTRRQEKEILFILDVNLLQLSSADFLIGFVTLYGYYFINNRRRYWLQQFFLCSVDTVSLLDSASYWKTNVLSSFSGSVTGKRRVRFQCRIQCVKFSLYPFSEENGLWHLW